MAHCLIYHLSLILQVRVLVVWGCRVVGRTGSLVLTTHRFGWRSRLPILAQWLLLHVTWASVIVHRDGSGSGFARNVSTFWPVRLSGLPVPTLLNLLHCNLVLSGLNICTEDIDGSKNLQATNSRSFTFSQSNLIHLLFQKGKQDTAVD